MSNIKLNKPSNKLSIVRSLIMRVNYMIQEKTYSNSKLYCKHVINDIIYNERANIVATFKDYLIFDDTSEFFKRSYNFNEINIRLQKIFEFYDSYSKIFPNYTVLTEAKYIYKNIQRKQKMIDKLQKKNLEFPEENKSKEEKIFITDVYDSIMNLTLSTMKPDQNGSNNNHIVLSKEKINKKDLNLSIKIEDSNTSLEGLIINIDKAEESTFFPVKIEKRMNEPNIEITKDGLIKIQSLLNKNISKVISQANVNQFNKKIEPINKLKRPELSPNVKLNKPKELLNNGKVHSPHDKNVFQSIHNNEKLNIYSLLDHVNQNATTTLKKKESYTRKSPIFEVKKINEMEYSNNNKNLVSHKLTLSIPKTTTNNNIYNNFNIINNFHDVESGKKVIQIDYSQKNIDREKSPKTNSARLIEKVDVNKGKINKKPSESMKPEVNTSYRLNSLNYNKKVDKESQLNILKKNKTKSYIFIKDSDGRISDTVINNPKITLVKNNSNQSNNPLSSKNIKLNTIRTPSYANASNSTNFTKRDRTVSLTARQVFK